MAEVKDRKVTFLGGTISNIEGVLTDKTLIDKVYNDHERAERSRKEEDKLIAGATTDVEGSLIIIESVDKELERIGYNRLSKREKLLKKYYLDRLFSLKEEAESRIKYLTESEEVSGERKSRAKLAWTWYKMMNPDRRRREYGNRYSIETLLGVRQAWEL